MKCPCGFEGEEEEFFERELYCDMCGGHGALECPACGRYYDLVFEEWDLDE